MFNRSMSALLACASLSLGALAAADDAGPYKAVVNLDGTRYMAFIPTNDEGEPDPDGRKITPAFVVLGRQGERLYGSSVMASVGGEGGVAANQVTIGLLPIPLVRGHVKGKRFSVYGEDPATQEPEDEPIRCKVLRNGNVRMTAPSVGSGEVKFTLHRLDEDDEVSGLYLGVISVQDAVPPANDNVVVGFFADNTDLTISAVTYLPSYGGVIRGGCVVADFDPATGEFNYQGDAAQGLPTLYGTVANGILTFNATMYGTVAGDALPAGGVAVPPQIHASGTLYFFGDEKQEAPTLRAPRPRSIAAGGERTVSIKCRYALPGALVAVRPAAGAGSAAADSVAVLAYRGDHKSIDIVLDVPAGAAGNYLATLTNPDGRSATAKKAIVVK